ncbi:MAG TPA: hypothetical protein VD970_18560 [Acetobacteraceae bacterium]|nr:hypothetical protein [Acetobacteraceae bacterium]
MHHPLLPLGAPAAPPPRRIGRLGALMVLALFAGCAEGETLPGARPGLASQAARLPAEAAGFQRGRVIDYEAQRPGYGVGVDYATPSRAAVATVSLYDRGRGSVSSDPNSGDIEGELGVAVQEAMEGAGGRSGRRMTESGRVSVPAEGGALRCARMEGSFGRSPVRRLVCVGGAGGRFLRVQVTMPESATPVANAEAFAAAMARAARGR